MKNLYFTLFILVSLISNAGLGGTLGAFQTGLSMYGLKIKVTDKTGAPISNYPVEISMTHSFDQLSFSCLFGSGAPNMNASLVCSDIRYSTPQKMASDESGLINLNSVAYSVSGIPKTMYINLRLAGTTYPNCENLNKYSYTHDPYPEVHTRLYSTIAFDRKLIAKLKAKNGGVITCVLE